MVNNEQYDAFLKSICLLGKSAPKFINGYSDEIAEYLQGLGFIKIDGDGVFKEVEVLDAGKEFNRKGGFISERKRIEQDNKSMALERKSKAHTIWYEKNSLWINLFSIIISIGALLVSIRACINSECY